MLFHSDGTGRVKGRGFETNASRVMRLEGIWTKAESQSRESVNFPTHSAVLSHDGLGNRCKKWARACQAGAPPRAASLIGVHASQSGALFVALQPEKREYFRGTEPTIYQPKAAPRPLYTPGTKTRIPAEPVTCERICGST